MSRASTLLVDPAVERGDATERGIVDVAVGVLIRSDGCFLMTTRPVGKAYAGYWEFPGGKVESCESVAAALARELEEELGVRPTRQEPWHQLVVDYPHALVHLHFVKVTDWQGDLVMRESQSSSWQRLPVAIHPILPGAIPVLDLLARERGYSGPTHGSPD